MKIFKSHFWYNKSQRNGILFLVFTIIILQSIYFFVDFPSDDLVDTNTSEILAFEKQIDSLRLIAVEERKPKMYPFNPNYITDYKGYVLGMSLEEIDRLHNFRKQNKFVNSVADFKRITQVNDTLLKKISPYFKFPDWVTKRDNNSSKKTKTFSKYLSSFEKKEISTTDINFATAEDFRVINGVGEVLSKRIINYREKLQGFSYSYQLYEIWNIKPEIITKLLSSFEIKEKPIINKVNINTASFKEVLKTPYVNYELCKKIFDYRDEVAELQSLSELKNIEGFPINKYDRIVLYLKAE